MQRLNPYEFHKKLINDYILKRPGDTAKLYERDTSKDKTDFDVIRENHRFLWENGDVDSWEKQLAKRYYDKLFREYCIADLSRYKENKIALRWRIEREVITSKGQFICGNKKCEERTELRSWEVNFAYAEHGTKKNALVKLRLCPECSDKLNYHSKKREIKRIKKQTKANRRRKSRDQPTDESSTASPTLSTAPDDSRANDSVPCSDTMEPSSSRGPEPRVNAVAHKQLEQIFWTKSTSEEEKTREEEFDEYLADLLL